MLPLIFGNFNVKIDKTMFVTMKDFNLRPSKEFLFTKFYVDEGGIIDPEDIIKEKKYNKCFEVMQKIAEL